MRLARRLRQQAEPGLSPSMLSALASIERLGPLTLGELAEAERVQPPTITRVVARLEETELVTRTPDPTDRRVARISLAPEGVRLIQRARTRKDAYLAARMRGLSDEEVATLSDALAILERMLEEDQS
jgi:DNA-binding MarR family transcriptional regulator